MLSDTQPVYVPPHPQAPTKASLKAWWNHFTFTQRAKKDAAEEKDKEHPVFGKPLKESLRYASVQISTANANGELYVWGYIPVVVAKCGLYLKENATEVEGTFRVNGSNKRMRDLQAAFEAPPRYGKSLDWKKETYTTHDVASVFRRYLTQMPEPVIPHDLYHHFRDALAKEPFNQDEVIATYKALIRRMPRPNQYLLLYVLDLLSVFARKCEKNLMTATNLAVIFRPGLISHPQHEMSPTEYALSQRVLEFLIAHQDWFMLDIPPPPPGSPLAPGQTAAGARITAGGGGAGAGAEEDINLIPSSDEEVSSQFGGGGWKLVSRGNPGASSTSRPGAAGDPQPQPQPTPERDRIKMMRRRTTMERTDPSNYGALAEGDMSPSPILESPDSPLPSPSPISPGATGVKRSRTLPSSRRRGTTASSSTAAAEPEAQGQGQDPKHRSVLRKQKRLSVVGKENVGGVGG